jgi:DnaJ-class molecular chaperone
VAGGSESTRSDLYAVLGVVPDATEKEIRDAYRVLARQSHHDRRPGDLAAEERFKQVNAAYEVLVDPARRADYDGARRRDPSARSGARGGRAGSTGPVTIPVHRVREEYLRTPRTPGRRRSGSTNVRVGADTGRRAEPRFARQGEDLAVTVPITYPEAVLGADVRVPLLDGEQITVRIPPGTPSGLTLRVRGQRAPSAGGQGDILVTVEIDVPRQVSEPERRAVQALAEVMDASRPPGAEGPPRR